MRKKVTWNELVQNNKSAVIDIPDEVIAEGDSAIMTYLCDRETELEANSQIDDVCCLEDFAALTVEEN